MKPHISYSQFRKYRTCPKSWQLAYRDGHRLKTDSIYTTFGTAVHISIQDSLVADKYLQNRFLEAFKKELEDKSINATREELKSFLRQGIILSKRGFEKIQNKHHTLPEVEVELRTPIRNDYRVDFLGYIDLVYIYTRDIYLIDIKTSTKTWSSDKLKENEKQLIFYKHFFQNKSISIPPYGDFQKKLNCQYIVLNRTEDPNFIQTLDVLPCEKKEFLAIYQIEDMVKECFKISGAYLKKDHEARPSRTNCRFCEFATNGLCKQSAYYYTN